MEDIMNSTHRSLVARLLVFSVMLTAGCGDSTPIEPAPTTGTLVIRVSTDSANVAVDPGSYTLVIDVGPGQSIGANATVTIAGLATGRHLVRLDDLPPNYTIDGRNPRSVYVGTPQAPSPPVSFSVRAVATDCGGCWDY
jgi:hypothetical protein